MRWSALLPLLVLLLLTAALWRGLGRDPTFVPSPLVGRAAPVFDLPDLDASAPRISDADLRGQVTLVNVWGTWCSGCRQEHAVLLDLARDGVRIIGIDWKDDPVAARAWLRELGDPYAAVAVDQEGRVAIDWGVYGAPETFVVDHEGKVRDKFVGPLTAVVVATRLEPLLATLRKETGR